MSEWQSMISAPMDGTEILGWRRDCGTLLIRYIAPVDFLTERELEREMREGLSEEDAETPDWFYADFVAGGRLEGDEVPTLWLPVPEPQDTL